MEIHQLGRTIAFGLFLWAGPAAVGGDNAANNSATAQALQALLDGGLVRRASLDQLARTVQSAKRSGADQAVLDYAHGLVLNSRVQPAKAVECFESALSGQPTYLPAWRALLRTRLIRKDTKSLKSDSLELARLVQAEAGWQGSDREHAARRLGEVAGFLAVPEVDLMKPAEREALESELQRELGSQFAAAFDSGKQSLKEQYEKLQQELGQEVEQDAKTQDQKAEEELAQLTDKSEELDQKTETLKLTREQWKTWLDERTKKVDDQLKSLEKEYKTLQQAALQVSQLVQQTQLDMGRYQTELAVQGIRGRDAEVQPGMVRLRQEAAKYQVQFQALEQRASGVMLRARRALAARSLAVKKYQEATGQIVRETETISRWQKNIEKSANEVENRDSKPPSRSLQKRLAMPASYFELDEKQEISRLIKQAGETSESAAALTR